MLTFEIILEILAALVSLIFVRYSANKAYRWITLILIITAINEAVFVPLIMKYKPFESNIDYNVFSLLDLICWYGFFIAMLKGFKGKSYVFGVAFLVGLSTLIDFILHDRRVLHSHSIMIYDLSIIVFSLYYLFIVLKKEYHYLWSDPFFFICIGCVLYHSINFINFASYEMKGYWTNPQAFVYRDIVQNLANATYYLSLCGAFFVLFIQHKKRTPT